MMLIVVISCHVSNSDFSLKDFVLIFSKCHFLSERRELFALGTEIFRFVGNQCLRCISVGESRIRSLINFLDQ